jgi:striatin 1/3/4
MERSDDLLIGSLSSLNQAAANLQNADLNTVLSANTNALTSSSANQQTGTNGAPQNSSEKPTNNYTMPGILHFLQHEWNRFEYERQQWEIDRAELLVSI